MAHPPGRAAFELLHCVGKVNRRRQFKEEMNMVGCSTRGDERETFSARDGRKIDIELGGAGGGDEGAALFGAEDTVDEIARVRVSHRAPSLRDSQCTTTAYPALKRGANERCAYGAGFLVCGRWWEQIRFAIRPSGLPLFSAGEGAFGFICVRIPTYVCNALHRPCGTPRHLGAGFPALKRWANEPCACGAASWVTQRVRSVIRAGPFLGPAGVAGRLRRRMRR